MYLQSINDLKHIHHDKKMRFKLDSAERSLNFKIQIYFKRREEKNIH